MTTPTKHLEIFDEKLKTTFVDTNTNSNGDLYLQCIIDDGESDAKKELSKLVKQHIIKTVISVLEQQIQDIETIIDLPPPYSADTNNPDMYSKHWHQNDGYRKGLQDSIDSLTDTLSTWQELLK